MKFVVRLLVLLCVVSTVSAQYVPERFWLGPTVGLSGLGFSIGVGASAEYAIDENFGVALDIAYSSFSEDFAGFGGAGVGLPTIKYDMLGAMAACTYHFKPGAKFDPFLKVGIGYMNFDVTYEQDGEEIDPFAGMSAAYSSAVAFTAGVGARYHFSDGLAGRATLGWPMVLGVGIDLAVGGVSGGTSSTGTTGTTSEGAAAVKADSIKRTGRENEYSLWVGPYIMGKGSIILDVAEGYKTGVVFNTPPDFGVSILAPFGKHSNIGFGLDIGLANYGYKFRPENDPTDSVTVVARYSYINIFPHLNLGGFVVGVNFGFVNGASARTLIDTAVSLVGTFRLDTNTSTNKVTTTFSPNGPEGVGPLAYMASMVEIRVGGAIPVVTSDFGRLSVIVQGGYSLTGIFEDFRNYQGSYPVTTGEPQESFNPHVVSLALGLSYAFRLGF